MASVLANAGRAYITGLLLVSEARYIGYGTGAGTAAAADTTLFTEVQTRTTGTRSQQTTSVTNDTFRVTGTVTADATRAVTNAGVFDASSNGNLIMKGDFSTINLASGDSIAFTFNLTFT